MIRSGRHPHEVMFLVFVAIVGVGGLLAPGKTANVVLKSLPPVFLGLFYGVFAVGSILALCGAYSKGMKGPVIEAFGLGIMTAELLGYGVAAHEGQLFGWANQLLGLIAALGLFLTAASGAVMWWRRRPEGLLGAPLPLGRPRFGAPLTGAVLLLGLLFPMFGLTLILVLALERSFLRRNAAIARWLGLARSRPAAS